MQYRHSSNGSIDTPKKILKVNHAAETVRAIMDDEINHREEGVLQGGRANIWYQPLRCGISLFTEGVIRFGMR